MTPDLVPCPTCYAVPGEPCDPKSLGRHPFHARRLAMTEEVQNANRIDIPPPPADCEGLWQVISLQPGAVDQLVVLLGDGWEPLVANVIAQVSAGTGLDPRRRGQPKVVHGIAWHLRRRCPAGTPPSQLVLSL